MSLYLGSTLLAGTATNTVYNANNLLDFKWTDYILNDQSWLRADTFSWNDGTVYSTAYNHLVADNSGGTSQTETVGSYTITYVLADDGHKITTDETTVANIYAESGVAWYYILDTVNTRFKLPRENPSKENLMNRAPVVVGSINNTPSGNNLLWSKANDATGTPISNANSYYVVLGSNATGTYYSTSTATPNSGGSIAPLNLEAKLSNSTGIYKGKKYLYFYVGNFSQSATEQTAGLNSSLFNGKADVDLSNAASNASASAKETIVGWGLPDYTTGVSRSWDTSYLADKDTIICYKTNHQSGNDNVKPSVSSDNSTWINLYEQNAGNAQFIVGGWFICPKGWYWKMTGGRNVDRALVSYIVKGEV